MARPLLLSVLVATLALPLLAAREPDARRGLRRLVAQMGVFAVFYWLVVMFATPRP